ncbi:MAG: GGDEF domain-containing protein, partial [Vibrio sp.]
MKRSDAYFDLVFERLDNKLTALGEANAKAATQLQIELNSKAPEIERQNALDNVVIQYDADKNQFGFAHDEYSDTAPNGTLIGYGKPTTKTLDKRDIFYKIDKIWSYSSNQTQFNSKFFLNFDNHYAYASGLGHANNQPFDLKPTMFSPERYRRGLGLSYQRDLVERGYFFTLPYQNLFMPNRVISVISPVVHQGRHIGDLGVGLDIFDFDRLFFLHPDFEGFVRVYLQFKHSNEAVDLTPTPTKIHPLPSLYSYQYELPYLGTIHVQYCLVFFLKQLSFLLLTTLLGLIVVNYAIYLFIKHKKEQDVLIQELNQDPMTKLYNRRIIDHLVFQSQSKIMSSKQEKTRMSGPIGMLTLDANQFKQINDVHGHQVGDMAIVIIADALKSSTRVKDICIRMGGDEFLVLVECADLHMLDRIGKRIQDYLAQTPVFGATEPLYVSVTYAYGVLELDESFDAAYKRIDNQLCQQKMSRFMVPA